MLQKEYQVSSIIMRPTTLTLALATTALARNIQRPLEAAAHDRIWEQHPIIDIGLDRPQHGTPQDGLSLIELSPAISKYVTDEEKWALRREGINFMDITYTEDLGQAHAWQSLTTAETVTYPTKPAHNATLRPLLAQLNKTHMRTHLETFTAFHTRYYRSDYGRQSSEWLLARVNATVTAAGAHKHGATVRHFAHPWGQNSVIATIPGKSERTVVVGAHQDSINLFFPSVLAAPGADDDGSGTVTILEALRVLLQDEDVVRRRGENTVEFHWYSAEEGGLLGSQAIFKEYERQGRDVKAMLQQDMTGYIQKTLEAGKKESVGVITDYVDEGLTEFIKMVITTVSSWLCLGRSDDFGRQTLKRCIR